MFIPVSDLIIIRRVDSWKIRQTDYWIRLVLLDRNVIGSTFENLLSFAKGLPYQTCFYFGIVLTDKTCFVLQKSYPY
jgi:hypothetical protein